MIEKTIKGYIESIQIRNGNQYMITIQPDEGCNIDWSDIEESDAELTIRRGPDDRKDD